jgi:tetratricopeptide (TPR) repeat protein
MIHRLFILVLFISPLSFSQEAALQFENANQLYRDGKYQGAIDMYGQIYNNGFESPSLHYNMGNAFFKLNNISRSILSFERARRLSPSDEDILYNLRLANLKVIDKIEPVPELFFIGWWNSFVNLMSSSQWAVLIICLLWVTAIATAGLLLLKRAVVQRILLLLSMIAIFFTIISFVGMFQRLSDEKSDTQAIIILQTVSVKSAPDDKSTDLFVLHEGVKVELLDYVAKWNKIKLLDGKVGWLEEDAVEVI